MYTRTLALLLALAFYGCKSSKLDNTASNEACEAITMGEAGESSPLTKLTARVDGNCLEMEVTYGGGCKAHEFDLVWSGAFAESLPPQATLFLVHRNNDDPCRAIRSEKVKFNLEKLQDKKTGQVGLNIVSNGVPDQRLIYSY